MRLKNICMLLLLLGVVTLVNAQTNLFEDGFETWPPTGWLLNGVAWVSATTSTISDVQPTIPYEGDYCAGMSSAPGNYMISPLKNNPGAYYFFVHKKDTGNHQFLVEFQSEDGVTPGADLTGNWTLVSGDWSSQGWWAPLIVNLTGFPPGYVRIKPTPPPPTPLKYMYFDRVSDITTPVELSSFTATLQQQLDQQSYVALHWTSQTETQVAGYNVLRNETADINTALQLNLGMVAATNTSEATNYEFTDSETQPGTWYYWLQSNDMNGAVQFFGPISIQVGGNMEDTPIVGIATELMDVYPNPFNPSVNAEKAIIPFQLTAKGNVRLDIYNQKGQLVWTYKNSDAEAGLYKTSWNGRNLNGKEMSSGVYFCRMSSGTYLGVKKLYLIK